MIDDAMRWIPADRDRGPSEHGCRRGARLRLDLAPGSAVCPDRVVVRHADVRRIGVLGGESAAEVADRLRDGEAYAFVSDVDACGDNVALLVVLADRTARSAEVNRYVRRLLRKGLEPLSARPDRGHAIRSYALAAAGVGLALLMTFLLLPPGGFGRSSLFLTAVMVASWYGGIRPGLAAALLSAAVIDYVVIPPVFELTLTWTALRELALFLAAAVTIGTLNETRLNRQRLERGRARLFASAALARAESLRDLARGLASPAASLEGALRLISQTPQDGASPTSARAVAERQVREVALMLNGFLLENGVQPEGGAARRDDMVLSGEPHLGRCAE